MQEEIKIYEEKMHKSNDALINEYSTIRAGRANPKVLDKLSEELKIPVGKTTEDGRFTLNATRCLGACGLAPVMMINDEVYGRLTPDEIPAIIAKYR